MGVKLLTNNARWLVLNVNVLASFETLMLSLTNIYFVLKSAIRLTGGMSVTRLAFRKRRKLRLVVHRSSCLIMVTVL